MTRDEAKKLIALIPTSAFTSETGIGLTCETGYTELLKTAFPEFNWRVILDRSGERSRWVLTIDDSDPREHYVPVGGTCIHCGKTARQLGVKERNEDGDEVELESSPKPVRVPGPPNPPRPKKWTEVA